MRAEIQAYLDGELRLEALPEELRDTALGWENLLAELDDDAGPMMAPGSIEASVMAEIVPVELGDRSITPGAHPIGDEVGSSAGESGSLRTESTMEAVDDARSAKPWILRPRNVRVTPLTGLLAAAAIAAIVIAPWRSGPTPEVAAEPTLYVQFVLEAPAARTVAVAGDFNEWGDGQPLVDPDGDGVWTGRIAVKPGIHEYMFIIDGTDWITPPDADGYRDDGFGSRNGVVTVLPSA